ncbi:uncharacterized protein LOC126894904 [Daktulosphaira vitifoliae]|uniref:uncharacterized protein LOC126894904 n=1 Tax=Daktulosphaira vitifoliae TaxID=58002 RepID=UPI0021AAE9D0|nr:uncharacterized protein LOC126894904 [Daktulosphaira vitifoliae]
MIVHTYLQVIIFLGLILTTIANEIIEYLSFKNLPVAREEFYNCLNNIEFDDNIQIDKESLYPFLNDIREKYVSGNLQLINTSEEVMKFIGGFEDLKQKKTSKELRKLIGVFEDLTLNKTSKELKNVQGGQTSTNIKDFEICCTMFHERLFRVEEPILTESNDIVAMALKKYGSAFDMLYDCFKKYHCLDDRTLPKEGNYYLFRDLTITMLTEVISETSNPQNIINRFQRNIAPGNNPFGKYCIAAYYTFLISENNGIFFAITVDAIMNLITLKNLPRAKTALYNCFTNNNLFHFIKNRRSFNEALNGLRKRIVSAEVLSINVHDEIIKFIKEDLSNFTNEIINCSTIFYSTLFEVTEPEILENENVYDLVYKRYDVAIDVLYDCFEKYKCFSEIRKKKLNNDFFRKSTIRYLKEVISKYSTPQTMINNVRTYTLGNNDDFGTYCSAAYYTFLTSDISFTITVDGIMNLITLKNLPRAKTALYNCFTYNNLIDFIKNRRSFDEALNGLRKRIVSAEVLSINVHDEIIKFIKEDLSNFTNEIINCSTIFYSTLFEVIKPEILVKENVDDLVSIKYNAASHILYECLEKYKCFSEIEKNTLNHDSFRISTIRNLKKVVSKTSTPQYMVDRVQKFTFDNNRSDFVKYCSAAYYTLMTLDKNRSRPWFVKGEKYLAAHKNVFRFPHQL